MPDFLLWGIVIILAINAWRRRSDAEENKRRWTDVLERINTLEQQLKKVVQLNRLTEDLHQNLMRLRESFHPLVSRVHALEQQVRNFVQPHPEVGAGKEELKKAEGPLSPTEQVAPSGVPELPSPPLASRPQVPVTPSVVPAERAKESPPGLPAKPAPSLDVSRGIFGKISEPTPLPRAEPPSPPPATPASVEPAAKAPPPAKEAPPAAIPKAPRAAIKPPSPLPPPGTEPRSPLPPPRFGTYGADRPSASERLKTALRIEEALGTNWLNKLGVIILVLGVAFFLAYQLQTLGPAGKVLVGCAVSGTLLGAGIFFEKNERWRVLARAGIGGGWALVFFTTYAMHHVPAARVLSSQVVGLVLMLVVAAAMVAHTLRYNSQVVSGLAFLLAFTTVYIGRDTVFSLTAGTTLALGLVVIVWRRRWFELEVFGILATFFNHYYWLRPIIEPMGAHKKVFTEINMSTVLLIFYWLIFRGSYLLRRITEKHEENVSSVAALLNTFLFHGVINYQSARPELAFWFLLGVGAVEMALGQLPVTRRRRTAFVILSTIGAVLLVAAVPYRYSGAELSVLWLMEAQALFFAGVFTREILFRRLGLLAAAVVAGHMVFVDAIRLSRLRDQQAFDFGDPRLGMLFGLAALVYYANAHWVPRRWPGLFAAVFEKWSLRVLSYLAGILALFAVWAFTSDIWWGVAWTALALALAFTAHRKKIDVLVIQANVLALLGIVRALAVNLPDPRTTLTLSWLSWRLTTVSVVIALLYLASRWSALPEDRVTRRISQAYTWAASTLVAWLMWYELETINVALGWVVFGLVLFELGFVRHSASLRFQGYVALVASFLRIYFVNLNAAGPPGEISPRVYTIVPLALAYYYVYGRLQDRTAQDFLAWDHRFQAAGIHSYLGTVALASLILFELPPQGVVAAWAALILFLLATAWKLQQSLFLQQGLLLGLAVLFRAVSYNFFQPSYFTAPLLYSRLFWVSLTVALVFVAVPVAFRLRAKEEEAPEEVRNRLTRAVAATLRHPEQVFFFIPFVLLTLLLAAEMRKGMVTVAWGVEAVAVFLFALWVGQRSYRLSGLGLLLLCVGKIVFVDVWGLSPRDRYLTFIVLGFALLIVSFLYTRYREVIRRYL